VKRKFSKISGRLSVSLSWSLVGRGVLRNSSDVIKVKLLYPGKKVSFFILRAKRKGRCGIKPRRPFRYKFY